LLASDDLARVINESVHERTRLAALPRFGRLVGHLAQLLELQPLKVHFLKVLHLRIAGYTFECTLGEVREACERLDLKVTSVNELIDIFLVKLFEFFFKRLVVLRQSVFRSAIQVLGVLSQVWFRALGICNKKVISSFGLSPFLNKFEFTFSLRAFFIALAAAAVIVDCAVVCVLLLPHAVDTVDAWVAAGGATAAGPLLGLVSCPASGIGIRASCAFLRCGYPCYCYPTVYQGVLARSKVLNLWASLSDRLLCCLQC
jgi:hypothetical protein